jgi:hypothetical protein
MASQISSASLDGILAFDFTLERTLSLIDGVCEHVVGVCHRVGDILHRRYVASRRVSAGKR